MSLSISNPRVHAEVNHLVSTSLLTHIAWGVDYGRDVAPEVGSRQLQRFSAYRNRRELLFKPDANLPDPNNHATSLKSAVLFRRGVFIVETIIEEFDDEECN